MDLTKVNINDKSDLEFIQKIYIESFPPFERRPISEFLQLINEEELFTVLLITEDNKRIGFFTTWTFDKFTYAEHFAISPEFRNGGYGKLTLDAFFKTLKQPLVIEVELPTDDMAKRRINFYKRMGFKDWKNITYEQPPYEKKYSPLPMMLMTYGNINLDTNISYVKNSIYTKVYNAEQV